MVSFTAHSDGKVIVPDEPVDLPKGQRLRVTVEALDGPAGAPAAKGGWLEWAREYAEQMPDNLPDDLAEQHDHYLYGTPKR